MASYTVRHIQKVCQCLGVWIAMVYNQNASISNFIFDLTQFFFIHVKHGGSELKGYRLTNPAVIQLRLRQKHWQQIFVSRTIFRGNLAAIYISSKRWGFLVMQKRCIYCVFPSHEYQTSYDALHENTGTTGLAKKERNFYSEVEYHQDDDIRKGPGRIYFLLLGGGLTRTAIGNQYPLPLNFQSKTGYNRKA